MDLENYLQAKISELDDASYDKSELFVTVYNECLTELHTKLAQLIAEI